MKKNYIVISIITLCMTIPLYIHCDEEVTLSLKNKELENQYTEYFEKAENHLLKGEFLKALDLYDLATSVSDSASDNEKKCKCLLKSGLVYWNLGQMKNFEEKITTVFNIAEKNNFGKFKKESSNILEINSLYLEGKKHRLENHLDKSIECFNKAIKIAKKYGYQDYELKCIRQLSNAYWRSNDLQNFYILSEEALTIAEKINHKREQGLCLNNIGLYYWKTSNYEKALDSYEKSLDISRLLNNEKSESNCLNNIGLIYSNLGIYEKSLSYLLKAYEIDKQFASDINISIDLNNIGNIYWYKGLLSEQEKDLQLALSYYENALEIAIINDFDVIIVKVLNNIGSIHNYMGNYYNALKFFRQANVKAEELQDYETIGMTLNNIGIVYYNLGNYSESTHYYQKAINLAVTMNNGNILWEAYLRNANSYRKQNIIDGAIENYKKSISTIENIRSQINLEEFKASYLGTDYRIQAYQNLIDLFVDLHQKGPNNGYDIEAFNYLERAKARAFLDSLEVSKIDVSQGVEIILQNKEKEIMNSMSQIYTKMITENISSEESERLKIELQNLEIELESLKREIREKNPHYASLKYPSIIKLEEAEKLIANESTAFFSYLIGEESSYAFVLYKNDLKIFPIPKRNDIKKLVKEYLQVISDKENNNFQKGYELFNVLIEPGINKKTNTIIFIPDDILNFLPFETLVTELNEKRWLINDYTISYAPSISSYKEILNRKNSNGISARKKLLAFGDPSFDQINNKTNIASVFDFFSSNRNEIESLKYSKTEIETIGQYFNVKDIFLGKNASEDNIKKHDLNKYKIIHFATHSIIDDKNHDRSSIILAIDNDPSEDGFLQVKEIYNLELNADLVTLSACETGLGNNIRGEGIQGLNRSFFFAGASSVMMSLWAVNDQATSQLMQRFYYYLSNSVSIVEALKKAKLEMISSENVNHPYFWAAFVISGDGSKVILKNKFNKIYILLFLFFIVTLLLYFTKRKLILKKLR